MRGCVATASTELSAIERALELAEETGCSLHFVHVSIAEGVAAVAEALTRRRRHLRDLPALPCCAPPTWSGSARSPSARPAARRPRRAVGAARARDARRLRPLALPARHEGLRVRHRLGRIAGAQTTSAAAARRGAAPWVPLARLADLVTGAPARRFRLPGKGRLEVGATPTSRWCRSAASTPSASPRPPPANLFKGRYSAPASSVRRCAAVAGGTAVRRPREERNLNERPEDHRRAFEFRARWEREAAPNTCAAFERLLPFRNKIIHVRWSGESAWIPLGDMSTGLEFENHTSHPAPGEILLYPGGYSETEILFPTGDAVRERRRAACRQPLPHRHRGPRAAARAWAHRAVGGRAGHRLRGGLESGSSLSCPSGAPPVHDRGGGLAEQGEQ